ncbi:hypothetical protein ACSTAY_01355 [Vreelandella alkaliphila]|uniref:hypothetical protein n=1 Tax=Halomonas sp. GT TaxID=1971364 RepID=UPI0009F2B1AD|nr:hypothetical protein [Halomonas sp. GT]
MRSEFWVKVLGALMVATGMGIGKLVDDPAFHIRVVQSGSHETVFILLALVIGFTFKDGNDSDSVSALVWAVFMAVMGLFMNGLNDLEDSYVQYVGFILYGGFTISLMGTLVYLMRAIKFRQ